MESAVSESMAALSLNDISVATSSPGAEDLNRCEVKVTIGDFDPSAVFGTVTDFLQANELTASLMVAICNRLLIHAVSLHAESVSAKRLVDSAHERMEALVAYVKKLVARYELIDPVDLSSSRRRFADVLPSVLAKQSEVAECKRKTDIAHWGVDQLVQKLLNRRAWYKELEGNSQAEIDWL